MKFSARFLGCFYFGILTGILLFILTTFNRSILDVARERESSALVRLFSEEKVGEFPSERSFSGLLSHFKTLASNQDWCWSSVSAIPLASNKLPTNLGPAIISDEVDLRRFFWKLKGDYLKPDKCAFPSDRNPTQEFASSAEYLSALTTQLSAQHEMFSRGYILQEISLQNPTTSLQNYVFSVGSLNGSALILLNGEPVAYFPGRSEASSLVSLQLPPRQDSTLSLLYYAKGSMAPGVNHPYFVGLLRHDAGRDHLFESSNTRSPKLLFTILFVLFLATILVVFGWNQQNDVRWPIFLAVLLVGFSLSLAIQLDHVQATLDGRWIRSLRYLHMATFVGCMIGMIAELAGSIEASYSTLWDPIDATAAHESRVRRRKFLIYGLSALPALFLFWEMARLIFAHLHALTYMAQVESIEPVLGFSLTLGSLLLLYASVCYVWQSRLSEDSSALELKKAVHVMAAGGASFIVYAISYRNFLSQWFVAGNFPTIQMLLTSQLLPSSVFLTVLFVISYALRKQAVMSKVLPEGVLNVLAEHGYDEKNLDATRTERDWIVLNDLSKSSLLKVSNLATVTHVLVSVFHKIHKDYFRDALHFFQNDGDAVLVALRSPKNARNGDPLLEKLVRCYGLHADGIRSFREAYDVILAAFKLENQELWKAIAHREEVNRLSGITLDQLGFRTIVTSDYYFYGVNHEFSNIDSKAIYVIAKSEKLIQGAHAGGFIVFPDLMRVLTCAYPEIESYFERCAIDKSKTYEFLGAFLPDHAFQLKLSEIARFESWLEERYGGPLYLRSSPFNGQVYATVRAEIVALCRELNEEIGSSDGLEAFIKKHGSVDLKNFREKNVWITAISNCAMKIGVWSEPSLAARLRNHILDVGIPGGELVRQIRKKDEATSPQRMLNDLRSRSTLRRNRAIRFLNLARVRSKFRPDAMAEEDFFRDVASAYLSKPSLFSVESHLAFYLFMDEKQERVDQFRSMISDSSDSAASFARLISYFESTSVRSLKNLALQYRALERSHDRGVRAA